VPRGVSESEINHTNKAQIPASRFLSLVLQACRYYFLVSKHKQFPLLLLVILLCGGPASFSQAGNAGASVAAAVVAIPFIGCKSDGQVGPLDAPTGQAPAIKLSAAAARRLAYYKAENGIGVLAPRGWRCFSTYGSNGSSLFVSPEAFDATRMFSTDWKSFAGPAIQISIADGGTSGRFQVAKVIARVFPDRRQFVGTVIVEGIEPASSLPVGPRLKSPIPAPRQALLPVLGSSEAALHGS